tara:strand:- start:8 stop:457 length:450 start_codon:yes stop_codon:yes gene_type:complete
MLAELAVANAAFGVIKSAIGNGRDLAAVGKQIGDWIGAEEQLKSKSEADKNSIFGKFMGKDTNDFESFLALDKIKEQRRQLESHMRLYGRPGLFDDWVLYQAESRKSRRAAAKQRVKDREELTENLMILGGLVLLVALLVGATYYLLNF